MFGIELEMTELLFTLPPEHVAVRDMARDFAAAKILPRALDWDRDKHFPIDVMREAATLGMGGIYVREDAGGSGLSRLDAALIFEALATGCPTVSAYLSIHNMCAAMIDRYGTDAQRQEYLPGMCRMDQLTAYCLTEPESGSDAAALKTTAKISGSQFVLNGTKQFISGAGAADIYIVLARTGAAGPAGISAILVPATAPGLSFGANERKMGWNAQPTRSVVFEDCRVPAGNLIGKDGEGFKIALSGLTGGRLNISACSLGGAQAAFDKAVAYMSERNAFGKTLNQFQGLQFRVAEMAAELEAARCLLYASAAAFDRADDDAQLRSSMTKLFVTDTAYKVANQALQMLGGYGYLAEYGIEKLVRDLRVHQILEGTNEIMRVIIARHILSVRS